MLAVSLGCALGFLCFCFGGSFAKEVGFHVDFPTTSKPSDLESQSTVREWVVMMNSVGASYNCSLPIVEQEDTNKEETKKIDAEAVLKTLETTPLFRVEGWWTYEFQWKGKLRQFHKDEKVTMEFSLGKFDSTVSVPSVVMDPTTHDSKITARYISGDICDLTGHPRETTVTFECSKDKHIAFNGFRESATCEYLITISVPALCGNTNNALPFTSYPILCYPITDNEQQQQQTQQQTQQQKPQKQQQGQEEVGVAVGVDGAQKLHTEAQWQEAVKRDASDSGLEVQEILYKVGTCFRHRKHKYRGVIIAADPVCLQTESWMDHMGVHSLKYGSNQPFYHVFVDERDRPDSQTAYVAQEDVEPTKLEEPIKHRLVNSIFGEFVDGYHVPRADVAVTLLPVDDVPSDLVDGVFSEDATLVSNDGDDDQD